MNYLEKEILIKRQWYACCI